MTHTLYPGICGPPLTDPLATSVMETGVTTFSIDVTGSCTGATFSIDVTGSCTGATCTASNPDSYTVPLPPPTA